MPPSLHPHLKQVSASDDFYTCPDDVIEEPPLDHDDAEQRAAKRRRVEAIASQYLRGRPPVILTASLKGPFDNGWKNPWAKPLRKEKQRPLGRTGKSKAGRTDDVRQKRISRTQSTAHSLAPSIASPETSRATREINLSAREQDSSLSNVEIPASTAPLPDEDSVCPPTDTFSADTGTCVRRQSPLTNPFWLIRPDSARVNMRKAASEQTDTSPTRSRSRHHSQTESVAELQISLPKVPIQVQKPSPRGISPGYGRSSASASMDISSPARDDHITSSATVCQVQSATPSHSTHPGQRSQRTIPIVTSSMGSQSAISRDDIQRSAERLVDIMSASQLSGRKTSQKTHTPTQEDDTASPLPSLPTYQEIGKVTKASKPHKPKPRAVNFDSSPEKGSPATERGHEASALEGVTDGAESEEASEAGSPSGEDATDISRESEVLHQNHASRESEWSTQAAMVRAQLEFQQSTFPALSPATLGAESQAPLDTPRAMLAVSNPVTTPLTVLSVPRDEPLPNDSAFRGPPISTQDLFGAASPFSFSTAKKKPDDSQRSQLGFGISPTHIKALKPSEAAPNSPSVNSERIPLKDKNTTSSFWSFVTDKASQGSPGRLGERSRCSMREIDVPHLNMDTSLDDFGRHYTGAFLRGIDDT